MLTSNQKKPECIVDEWLNGCCAGNQILYSFYLVDLKFSIKPNC